MRGLRKALLAGMSFCAASGSTLAETPGSPDPYAEVLDHLGDGYPRGVHFDLHIFGVPPGYPCATPNPASGDSGNVAYVPNDGRLVRVLLESGAHGFSGKASLEVTDACAGFEGPEDAAVLRLPEHPGGYAAFARSRGRPPADERLRIFDPEPGYVPAQGDGAGSLLFLGVVNADGVFTATDQVFHHPGGAQPARDITSLFLWAGMVCYPFGLPDDHADTPGSVYTEECCELADREGDGTPDRLGSCGLEVWDEAVQDDTCQTEWLPCVDYAAAETWVFNLPDLGDTFRSSAPSGVTNLQILFYPVP